MGAVASTLGSAAGLATSALHNGPLLAAVGIPLAAGTLVGLHTLAPIFTW